MNFESNNIPLYGGEPAVKKSKKGWGVAIFLIVIGVIVSVIVTAVGTVGIMLSRRVNSDAALRNTVKTFLPNGLYTFGEGSDGCEISITGKLGSDLIPAVGSNYLDVILSGSFDSEGDAVLLDGSVGAGEGKLGGKMWLDGEKAIFSGGDLTSGKWYEAKLDGIDKAIDSSPFAPGSGSDYAMSEEARELIIQLAEAVRSSDDDKMISDAVQRVREAVEYEIGFEFLIEADESSYGGYRITKSYSLSEEFLPVLIQAIREEWQPGSDVRKYVEALVREEYVPESGYPSADAYVSAVTKSVDEMLDAYEKLTAVLEYTSVESGKYLHSVDMKLSLVDDEGNQLETLELTWRLTEEEEKIEGKLSVKFGDQRMKIELFRSGSDTNRQKTIKLATYTGAYKDMVELTLSFTEYDYDGYDIMSEYEVQLVDKGAYNISIAGKYQISESEARITLASFASNYYGEKLDLQKSTLEVVVKPTEGAAPDAPVSGGELFAMSEAELDSAFGDLAVKLEKQMEAINDGCSANIFVKDYALVEPSSWDVMMSGSFEHIAYDSETDKYYFLLPYDGDKRVSKLYSYSEQEGFVKVMEFGFDILDMEIAKGKITVVSSAYKNTTVSVYDIATATHQFDITLEEMGITVKERAILRSAALYGNKLYIAYGDQWSSVYIYNIETKTKTWLLNGGVYGPTLTLDDRSGTMLVTESGITTLNCILYKLDTLERVIGNMDVDGFYAYPFCLNGYYWVDEAAISVDGTTELRIPQKLGYGNVAFNNGRLIAYNNERDGVKSRIFMNNLLLCESADRFLSGVDNGDGTYTFLVQGENIFGFVTYEIVWTGSYSLNLGE